jgi:hypothetical protein
LKFFQQKFALVKICCIFAAALAVRDKKRELEKPERDQKQQVFDGN